MPLRLVTAPAIRSLARFVLAGALRSNEQTKRLGLKRLVLRKNLSFIQLLAQLLARKMAAGPHVAQALHQGAELFGPARLIGRHGKGTQVQGPASVFRSSVPSGKTAPDDRQAVPGGNVSRGTKLRREQGRLPIGRRMSSCPTME